MDQQRTPATEIRETWAAAQVDAVAGEVERKAKRRRKAKDEPPAKVRGVFFRARAGGEVIGPGNVRGEWFTLWYDATGGRHREKAGTKAAAVALYQRRQTEKRQGRHFPESMRQRDA